MNTLYHDRRYIIGDWMRLVRPSLMTTNGDWKDLHDHSSVICDNAVVKLRKMFPVPHDTFQITLHDIGGPDRHTLTFGQLDPVNNDEGWSEDCGEDGIHTYGPECLYFDIDGRRLTITDVHQRLADFLKFPVEFPDGPWSETRYFSIEP